MLVVGYTSVEPVLPSQAELLHFSLHSLQTKVFDLLLKLPDEMFVDPVRSFLTIGLRSLHHWAAVNDIEQKQKKRRRMRRRRRRRRKKSVNSRFSPNINVVEVGNFRNDAGLKVL